MSYLVNQTPNYWRHRLTEFIIWLFPLLNGSPEHQDGRADQLKTMKRGQNVYLERLHQISLRKSARTDFLSGFKMSNYQTHIPEI